MMFVLLIQGLVEPVFIITHAQVKVHHLVSESRKLVAEADLEGREGGGEEREEGEGGRERKGEGGGGKGREGEEGGVRRREGER